jgi:hypothetical protein
MSIDTTGICLIAVALALWVTDRIFL